MSNSIKGQAKKLILDDSSYPGQLQKLLGDKFNVINCGVGGETSLTIMARQGSAPMRLAHSVIIYDDNHKEFDNFLGNATIPAFKADWCFGSDSDPFRVVAPLLQCHYEEYSQAYVNPCVIKGREFMIKSETNFWRTDEEFDLPVSTAIRNGFVFEYNYYIEPLNEQHYTDTIPAGTLVVTKAMRELRGEYANIFFIGQNGGYRSIAELIAQIKAMIKYSMSERYIVISFHTPNNVVTDFNKMTQMEDSLELTFGKRFVNLRKVFGAKRNEGVDEKYMKEDKVHFTDEGYGLIAEAVMRKIEVLRW